ncbi:50S ribosomal protein L15 [Candidatus Dependentiae bacterium]|nr:50S ribosomal protein L15 [Candidatus Dependentiae bacterium]
MLLLNNLEKITKPRKRVGRGGSRGGTSGRGHKGQKSRPGAGGEIKDFFEGGQMPLARRIPRRGFKNFTREETRVINLSDLEERFENGALVDRAALMACGLLKGQGSYKVKILGNGTLSKALTVKADAFSKSAVDAITKNKGKVELSSEELSSGSITA